MPGALPRYHAVPISSAIIKMVKSKPNEKRRLKTSLTRKINANPKSGNPKRNAIDKIFLPILKRLFANRTFYNKFVKPAKNPEKLI